MRTLAWVMISVAVGLIIAVVLLVAFNVIPGWLQ